MLCHHLHFSVCLIGVVLMKRPTAIQPPGVSTHILYLCSCGNRGLGTNTFCGFIASPISSIMILDTRHSDRTQCCRDVIFPPPTLAVPSLSVRYSSIVSRLLQPCNTLNDRAKQYVCDRLIRLCVEWYFSR